jgi:hypothetical protein
MFRCILCRTPHDDSARTVEHVFPEAIGGTLTMTDMCKACNDMLGHSADVVLADHFLIKMDRRLFKLGGKGNVPNPFARGTLHETEGNSDVRWERGGYLYRFPSTITADGRNELRLDPRDAEKADAIRRRADSRRPPDGTPLKVTVAGPLTHSTTSFPVDTSMHACQRALVKITYEIAAISLGERYLDSPRAKPIREYLLDPTASLSALEGRIRFYDGGYLSALAAASKSVLIGVSATPGTAVSYVRIFDRCELGLFLDEESCTDLSPDGFAYVIDVSARRLPLRTTLRSLGWFGAPKGS